MHTHKEGLVAWWEVKFNKKHYIRVFVWDSSETLEKMNNITKANGYAVSTKCFVNKETKEVLIPKKYGEIHLVTGKYGVGTAAHEIWHIASFWAMLHDWNFRSQNERMARLIETLTRRFWNGHYENFE
jgi:predicted transcriptional regulator YdeE